MGWYQLSGQFYEHLGRIACVVTPCIDCLWQVGAVPNMYSDGQVQDWKNGEREIAQDSMELHLFHYLSASQQRGTC